MLLYLCYDQLKVILYIHLLCILAAKDDIKSKTTVAALSLSQDESRKKYGKYVPFLIWIHIDVFFPYIYTRHFRNPTVPGGDIADRNYECSN